MKDEKFNANLKATFESCIKEVNEKFGEIQKKYEEAPHNIKKDQCNVKAMAVNSCAIMDLIFKVSLGI